MYPLTFSQAAFRFCWEGPRGNTMCYVIFINTIFIAPIWHTPLCIRDDQANALNNIFSIVLYPHIRCWHGL